MHKKSITTCLAMAAVAVFAMPAIASAAISPALTDSTGALVPAGTKVKATNIGNTLFTSDPSGPTVTCTSAILTGEITKNKGNGEAIEGNIESASFTGTSGPEAKECSSSLGAVNVTTAVSNGTPWCVKALPGAGDVLNVRGGKCTEKARAITFILDVTTIFGTVECAYERTTKTGPVTGTYTTQPADARGTIAGGANSTFAGENTNPGTCPENGTLDMEFELQTSTGGTLAIS